MSSIGRFFSDPEGSFGEKMISVDDQRFVDRLMSMDPVKVNYRGYDSSIRNFRLSPFIAVIVSKDGQIEIIIKNDPSNIEVNEQYELLQKVFSSVTFQYDFSVKPVKGTDDQAFRVVCSMRDFRFIYGKVFSARYISVYGPRGGATFINAGCHAFCDRAAGVLLMDHMSCVHRFADGEGTNATIIRFSSDIDDKLLKESMGNIDQDLREKHFSEVIFR